MVFKLSVYEYEVFRNKNPKKLLVVNSSYAVAYLGGAILAPRSRHGEGIPRLGLGLRRCVGSLHCGVGAR